MKGYHFLKHPMSNIRYRLMWICLSLLLIGPAIGANYLNDDYFFNSMLYEADAPFGYYDFLSGIDTPMIPWWSDDAFRVRFFRPLASLTLHLDFSVSPDNALFAHLHSALWLVMLMLGAFALFDRWLDKDAARFAYPVFSLGLFTAWAAGWISARHAIMGGTFAVWALVWFIDLLRTGRRFPAVLSLSAFSLGLLSSESAIAFGAAAVLLTMFEKEDITSRVRYGGPPLMLSVVYLLAYKLGGFGARGSDLYVDPLQSPVAYLDVLPSKMLALWGSFSFGVPAMMRIIPNTRVIPVVGGLAALSVLFSLTSLRRYSWSSDTWRRVRLLWLAVPLTMLPEMSGMVEGRGALLAAVLFCALIGLLLQGAFIKDGARQRLRRVMAGILVGGVLVLSPLSRVGAALFIYLGASNLVAVGSSSDTGCRLGQDVYQINGDSLMSVMSPFVIARQQGKFFDTWNPMAQAPNDFTMTRTGTNSIRLEADEGVVKSYLWLFRRPDSSWKQGMVVRKNHFQVTVRRIKNGTPTIIDYQIDGLSDDRACLVRADGFTLKHQPIPQMGEHVKIKWIPLSP